jgi:transposase
VNENRSTYYYHRLREIICQATENKSPFSGEIEVDESYFRGKHKGKRGRAAARRIPVFGLLKRGDKIYAKIIGDAKSTTWRLII